MLFKLASERPSKITGVRLSIDTSHCTTFGKRPSMRDQDRVGGSCINYKIDFLTCHVKDHLGLLDRDRHLMKGSRQSPWASSVV